MNKPWNYTSKEHAFYPAFYPWSHLISSSDLFQEYAFMGLHTTLDMQRESEIDLNVIILLSWLLLIFLRLCEWYFNFYW